MQATMLVSASPSIPPPPKVAGDGNNRRRKSKSRSKLNKSTSDKSCVEEDSFNGNDSFSLWEQESVVTEEDSETSDNKTADIISTTYTRSQSNSFVNNPEERPLWAPAKFPTTSSRSSCNGKRLLHHQRSQPRRHQQAKITMTTLQPNEEEHEEVTLEIELELELDENNHRDIVDYNKVMALTPPRERRMLAMGCRSRASLRSSGLHHEEGPTMNTAPLREFEEEDENTAKSKMMVLESSLCRRSDHHLSDGRRMKKSRSLRGGWKDNSSSNNMDATQHTDSLTTVTSSRGSQKIRKSKSLRGLLTQSEHGLSSGKIGADDNTGKTVNSTGSEQSSKKSHRRRMRKAKSLRGDLEGTQHSSNEMRTTKRVVRKSKSLRGLMTQSEHGFSSGKLGDDNTGMTVNSTGSDETQKSRRRSRMRKAKSLRGDLDSSTNETTATTTKRAMRKSKSLRGLITQSEHGLSGKIGDNDNQTVKSASSRRDTSRMRKAKSLRGFYDLLKEGNNNSSTEVAAPLTMAHTKSSSSIQSLSKSHHSATMKKSSSSSNNNKSLSKSLHASSGGSSISSSNKKKGARRRSRPSDEGMKKSVSSRSVAEGSQEETPMTKSKSLRGFDDLFDEDDSLLMYKNSSKKSSKCSPPRRAGRRRSSRPITSKDPGQPEPEKNPTVMAPPPPVVRTRILYEEAEAAAITAPPLPARPPPRRRFLRKATTFDERSHTSQEGRRNSDGIIMPRQQHTCTIAPPQGGRRNSDGAPFQPPTSTMKRLPPRSKPRFRGGGNKTMMMQQASTTTTTKPEFSAAFILPSPRRRSVRMMDGLMKNASVPAMLDIHNNSSRSHGDGSISSVSMSSRLRALDLSSDIENSMSSRKRTYDSPRPFQQAGMRVDEEEEVAEEEAPATSQQLPRPPFLANDDDNNNNNSERSGFNGVIVFAARGKNDSKHTADSFVSELT